jgi:CheY-like chemotaxis protein
MNLEDEGYVVSAAANVREALALLRTVSIALPRLILLDLLALVTSMCTPANSQGG